MQVVVQWPGSGAARRKGLLAFLCCRPARVFFRAGSKPHSYAHQNRRPIKTDSASKLTVHRNRVPRTRLLASSWAANPTVATAAATRYRSAVCRADYRGQLIPQSTQDGPLLMALSHWPRQPAAADRHVAATGSRDRRPRGCGRWPWRCTARNRQRRTTAPRADGPNRQAWPGRC